MSPKINLKTPAEENAAPVKTRVAVVGAGIAGLVTALTLQEEGHEVRLYERSPVVGPETCSWLAGGMLAPWCEREGTDPEVVARGAQAIGWWRDHYAGTESRGSLVLSAARDRSELARFGRNTSHHRTLDGAEIAALEPDLAGLFEEGLFYEEEAHLDPRFALPALAERFVKNGGVLKTGQAVELSQLREEIIVDCRGLAARDRLEKLRGVRGEMLRLRTHDVTFNRPVRLAHPWLPIYIVPRAEGEIMVGATSVETDHDGPVTARAAAEFLEAARRLHPALGEAEVIELGVGVRPAYPDNLPDVTVEDRVVSVNGLYRHGYLLTPWGAAKAATAVRALLSAGSAS